MMIEYGMREREGMPGVRYRDVRKSEREAWKYEGRKLLCVREALVDGVVVRWREYLSLSYVLCVCLV